MCQKKRCSELPVTAWAEQPQSSSQNHLCSLEKNRFVTYGPGRALSGLVSARRSPPLSLGLSALSGPGFRFGLREKISQYWYYNQIAFFLLTRSTKMVQLSNILMKRKHLQAVPTTTAETLLGYQDDLEKDTVLPVFQLTCWWIALKWNTPVASRAFSQSAGYKMTHALLLKFQRLLWLVHLGVFLPPRMSVRMLPLLRQASSIFMRLDTGYNNWEWRVY